MAIPYLYHGLSSLLEAVEGRLAEAGFKRVDDVATASIVLTYCVSQTELEDLYFDENGYIQMMDPGSLIIDLSPSTPNFSRELGAIAAVSDLSMVEAPLVVKNPLADQAFDRENLACFLAGDDKGEEIATPLLSALVGEVHPMGSLGAAQLARAALSMQVAAQAVAAVEAAALFDASRRSVTGAGLPEGMPGAISEIGELVLNAMADRRFEGAYTIEMLMAELSAALMAADDAELILPQTEAAMHLLELLAIIGGSDKNLAALSLVYGEESESARYGLDWSRAEQAYGSDHGEHDHDYDEYGETDDDEDEFGFGGTDQFGSYSGGFGYSSN